MFAIYKYVNDPLLQVKSAKYTEDNFLQCKDLLPNQEETLFETSILKDYKAKQEKILKA